MQVSIFELIVEHDQHSATDCSDASFEDLTARQCAKILQLDLLDRLVRHHRHQSLNQQAAWSQ